MARELQAAEVMEFARREFQMIQAVLDGVMVPTHCNGERLSASQRVQELATAYRRLAKHVGMERH